MDEHAGSEHQRLGRQLELYCRKYSIPIENFFEIINDQKVLPMLRGKGMEYNVYHLLQQVLSSNEWIVTKLNLSAQPGLPDQDISVTHRRTGEALIGESKSAVRGSMTTGVRARRHRVPHFKVKSHRSRSNIELVGIGNDRYRASDFDILVTNPSNALFAGGTVGEELELIADPQLIEILYSHYSVSNSQELLQAAAQDWRFVIPGDIAENGLIPRTPTIYLQNDPHWLPITALPNKVEEIVRRRVLHRRSGRSS